MATVAHGGQVLISGSMLKKLQEEEFSVEGDKRFTSIGYLEVPSSPSEKEDVYQMKVKGLEARFFDNIDLSSASDLSSSVVASAEDTSKNSSHKTPRARKHRSAILLRPEGTAEDDFLTSANMCRWIIDYNEIQIKQQLGVGSYGIVYMGKWKGVDVAVKRFIKQKLTERRSLEFRAEVAFLSELHHPNIVLFIGACVKSPNLCLITEFVKRGSLKENLIDSSIKLPWQRRLQMLHQAALGISYLHSFDPCIIHRDLKTSNLLVDESWNVKVADFGFARIKEENATMTRCGTPCWTAPEVLRGEKYSEKADVYSFGVVMWEVLTRKQPYAGANFMTVSLDVLEGRRPPVPSECPAAYSKLMRRSWHAEPSKRPAMTDLVAALESQIAAADSNQDNQLPQV